MSFQNATKGKPRSIWARFSQLSLIKKGAVVVIMLLLLWFFATRVFGQKNSTSQYQTATAQRMSIISSVSESGAISAESQIAVTSPSTGIIKAVYVKNGDVVNEGRKLFEVKATATPQEQALAFATYESALSSYRNSLQAKQAQQATLETDRQAVIDAQTAVNNETNSMTQLQKDSLNSKLTSADETFTADETKYNNEDTAIVAANAQLNSSALAYQATQDSVVTAPVSGTIANLAVSVGNSVSASTNNNSSSNSSNNSGTNSSSNSSTSNSSSSSSGYSASGGSTVLVIGDFSHLSVVASVNEVDIPKVKIGQNATVTLNAFPNETFVGKVESVDSIGVTTSGVVTYNVYINLIAPPSNIRSGMTASVVIQTARHDNVVTVPTAAVQTSSGASYVQVLKNGKVTIVQVTTGISDDTNTEITAGINEGDVVITGTNTTGNTSSTTSPFSGGGFGGNRGGGSVFFRGGGARGG